MSRPVRLASRRTVAVASLISLVLVTGTPGSAQAARAAETRFAAMVNETRATALLPPLVLKERLCERARKHSRRMAERGSVFHSSVTSVLNGSVAENVGSGGTLADLHRQFLASPGHAQNILGSYTRTGVGVVRSGGRFWLTQIFAS